jgi:hypothetical protein
VLSAHHDLGFVTLPTFATDLVLAGIGLGLVIAPLTAATLRVVPAAQHGIASAAVVVARMIGMLIGVSALSAFGLYFVASYIRTHPVKAGDFGAIADRTVAAYFHQFGAIFTITAVVCVVGALLGVLIAGRHEHAEEPAAQVTADASLDEPELTQ